MADKKISELTSGSPPQVTDAIPISRAGTNVKLLVSDLQGMPGAFTWDSRKVIVASSSLKNAFSSPVDLYPGSTDSTLVLAGRVTIRKLAGTAYNLNGNSTLILERSPAALLNITLAGFLDSSDQHSYNWYGNGGATILTSSAMNTSIRFRLNVADMTVGSGDLEVALSVEKHPLFYTFST